MVIIKAGNSYNVSFQFKNTSNNIAKSVVAQVSVDPNLTLNSIISTVGIAGPGADEYTLGDMLPLDMYEIIVNVTVDVEDALLPLTMVVTTDNPDTDITNNTVTKNLVSDLEGILCSEIATCIPAPPPLGDGTYGDIEISGSGTVMTVKDAVLSGDELVDDSILNRHLDDDIVGADELIDTAVTAGSYTNAAITVDDQGRITAAANGSPALPILSLAGNYTIILTDSVILKTGITGGGDTVTLPSSAASGQRFTIKDATGTAATDNITIDTAGAELIDGAATLIINGNYGGATMLYDGANYYILSTI